MVGARQIPRRNSVATVAWRASTDIAHVYQRKTRTAIAPGDLERALAGLRDQGFCEAVTWPLRHDELEPFLAADFSTRERLWLLRWRRPAAAEPGPARRVTIDTPPGFRMRTVGGYRVRSDIVDIVDIDRRAFDDFWRFDAAAFAEARRATRLSRLRIVEQTSGPRTVAGYAAFGLAGTSGYLQRLAVDPDQRRKGLATDLVADGLAWLSSYGARSCLVNTQETNRSALKLYLSLGFEFEPHQLTVLSRRLATPPAPPAEGVGLARNGAWR